jgi:hypothetical protein
MYGKATLKVPWSDNVPEVFVGGLSDQMAMSYGTLFARTLSDEHAFVEVTLSSGSVRVIGLCTLTGKIHIGRLHPNYRAN